MFGYCLVDYSSDINQLRRRNINKHSFSESKRRAFTLADPVVGIK